jgi:hypothetical protein
MPLEALLLLVLLAGADPGPVPGLERLLAWGLGVLAPTLLLWQRPADCCSLLVAQVPIKARSDQQRRLASLQGALAPRLLLALGAALLLPGFWWLDGAAALAGNSSPLVAGNRLVVLLLAIPLLALLLWQWHQLSQSLWLLSRPPGALASATPLSTTSLENQRLCLGIPLLLLPPLEISAAQPATTEQPAPTEQPPAPQSPASAVGEPVAVKPEQTAESDESGNLDQQVP